MRRKRDLLRRYVTAGLLLGMVPVAGCDEGVDWNPVGPNGETYVEHEVISQSNAGLAAVEARTANGGITIDSGPHDRLWIRVTKEARADDAFEAEEAVKAIRVHVVREGNEVRIFSDRPPVAKGVQIEVSYEIECPPGIAAELRAGNGEIHVSGVPAEVRAVVGNGRIVAPLDKLAGRGDFQVGNGTVQAWIPDGNPSLQIDSGNGRVELRLHSDYSGNLNARTGNGRVRCDLPLDQIGPQNDRRIEGVLGGGGSASIDIRATNGTVLIARIP